MADTNTKSADERRPSPKALLELAAKESRGKLKVFLGMAPGVGKTYAMLTPARAQKADGVDVVVGVVETHGRSETAALLDGLEVLPRKTVTYRRRTLMEFDVEAAIARRPKLLLVDEFAHTNAPGADPSQALPGCRGDPAQRNRRVDHTQHPAPGKPDGCRAAHHRRTRAARRCPTR